VEKLEGLGNAGDDKLSCRLIEAPLISQDRPHFATQARFQQEIDKLRVTERPVEAANEWTIGTCKRHY
jgi:hypothetical protein